MNHKDKIKDIIDTEWHRNEFAQVYLNSLLHRGQRRQFGLLETPSLPLTIDISVINYKIFICGRSGTGKTSTVARLAGSAIPKAFSETAGIEITTLYWPVFLKAVGKVLFFRLNFWDVGDNAIKKFEHILPACQSEVDCYLYTFSFTDRSSFDDVPQLMSRMSGNDVAQQSTNPVHIFLGTKADQYNHSYISQSEVKDLSARWNIPVLRTKNVNDNHKSAAEQIFEIAPILDTICGKLWLRDQSRVQTKRGRRNPLST